MSKEEASRLSGGRYKWVIKKEVVARSVGACVLDPYEVRLGKDRLFEDDVYSRIFNGRPASEYLTFYWLDRLVSYWGGRQDSRRSSARWLVLNFIWLHLGLSLKSQEIRERFRYIAERWNSNVDLIRPLDDISDSVFSDAMAFYRANKHRYGKTQEERDFFKHANLHRGFEEFWNKQPS